MFRRLRRTNALFFTAVLTSFATVPVGGWAAPPPENLLPSDTLMLATVPDFAALRTAAKQSPGWLFWNDPAMKPFHDKFMAAWNSQFIGPLEHDLGVQFNDYASLPQGQLTFAITQNGWNGGDDPIPGTLLLMDARDKGGMLKTNLDALRHKWIESGKAMHTETVRGVSFSVVTLSSNDMPPTLAAILPKHQPVQELGKEPTAEKPGQLVVGQYGSMLIVGNSLKAVDPVIAHLSGGAAPALSDNANFAADRLAQFHDQPLYYGWFNAKALFDVLAHIPAEQPNPEAPTIFPRVSPAAVLDALGLTGLKSASVSYRETHDGAQLNLYLSAPESYRQGLLKIFSVASKDANPPPFVPASTVKFSRCRIDGQKSWAEMERMLGTVSPRMLDTLDRVIDMANAMAQQKDPGFDLRRNLIGNLGDDFISYQAAPTGNSPAELANPPSLLLFSAANADQVIVALKSVLSMLPGGQNAPEPRDFLGRKIYTVPWLGGGMSASGSPSGPHWLYCAASGGYVAVTPTVSMLEEYLRSDNGQARPLRDTAGLADAAEQVGGARNGLFAYENEATDARSRFAALKLSPSDPAEGLALVTGLDDGATTLLLQVPLVKKLCTWMDFSLLPDYDQEAKYYNFSVTGGGATPQGLYIKFFTPRPPQLN